MRARLSGSKRPLLLTLFHDIQNPKSPIPNIAGIVAAWVIALTLSVCYGLTLAPGVTWANGGSDSGDLMTAVATLGVPHPSGYPTYVLLARAFLLLPLGDAARQQAMFSAVCAILAALIVAALVRDLGVGRGWRGAAAGALAALWLGCSPLFWSQAVITEIYSLHALLCAIIWWCAARYTRPDIPAWGWADRAAGLVAGLALGNHLTALAPVLALLVHAGLHSPAVDDPGIPVQRRLRRLGATLLWLGAGLLIYLYLPLSARSATPASWGDPGTVTGLRWLVSGQAYHELAFRLPGARLADRLSASAALLLQQFGPLGLGLGIWGLLVSDARRRHIRATMLLTALATSAFAVGYAAGDSYVYLLPAYLLFAIWIGMAASDLIERAAGRPGRAALLAALLAAGVAWRAPAAAAQADASHDWRAIQFAAQALDQAPPESIILTREDRDTFPLWYYHVARGVRADIAVVAEPLLPFDWYRAHLQQSYPSLRIPNGIASGWGAALLAGNRGRPICRTQLEHAPSLRCSAEGDPR